MSGKNTSIRDGIIKQQVKIWDPLLDEKASAIRILVGQYISSKRITYEFGNVIDDYVGFVLAIRECCYSGNYRMPREYAALLNNSVTKIHKAFSFEGVCSDLTPSCLRTMFDAISRLVTLELFVLPKDGPSKDAYVSYKDTMRAILRSLWNAQANYSSLTSSEVSSRNNPQFDSLLLR